MHGGDPLVVIATRWKVRRRRLYDAEDEARLYTKTQNNENAFLRDFSPDRINYLNFKNKGIADP